MTEVDIEAVAAKILVIREKKVMLDRDLAYLYGVAAFWCRLLVHRIMWRTRNDPGTMGCPSWTGKWGQFRMTGCLKPLF